MYSLSSLINYLFFSTPAYLSFQHSFSPPFLFSTPLYLFSLPLYPILFPFISLPIFNLSFLCISSSTSSSSSYSFFCSTDIWLPLLQSLMHCFIYIIHYICLS